MYDKKNDANEFIADTRSEAIAAAKNFYAMDVSELNISEPPSGHVYGLGGRAVVVAVPKNAKPPSRPSGGEGGRREERGGGRDRGRGRDRDGGRDGGRGRGRDGGRDGGRGGGDRGGRSERDAESAPRAEVAELAEVAKIVEGKATLNGEVGEIGAFVAGAIERMKVGDVEVAETRDDGMLVIQVSGSAATGLGQGAGRAMDALQLLANQAAKKSSADAPRVVIDVEGVSDDREDSLRELAARALKRAQSTSRSIALDPMSSHDRRIVHLVVRDEEGVATMSIGTGRFRQVLVVPEGAAEYDEAIESGEGAAS